MAVKNIFKQWFKTEDAPVGAKPHSEVASSLESAPATVSGKAPSSKALRAPDPQTTEAAFAVLGSRWQTEKATRLEADATYSFLVSNNSNAPMVARAFRMLTGVKPERVHMLWRFPKRAARGHLTRRRQKLARIAVAKGVTVNFPVAKRQEKQDMRDKQGK